jgi:predicted pyridoxine 5'-phosphate oxidase superfamily flavin-nucleotide-binding protein
MDERYHEGSRELQDRFDTRRLADRIDERLSRDHIAPADRAFIERMDMFFLATSDRDGQPQCSYKGGAPGFVRVLDEHTLAFPNYDGNGMFLSWGNALVNPQVGLLFIDFVAERPTRLRVEGTASVGDDDELLAQWPEAQFVVRVRAQRVFPNCPRYIHRMALVERSSYVPRAGVVTPIPEWKRGELASGVLPETDRAAKLGQPADLEPEPSDDRLSD